MTRGIRNNNPANIRHSISKWQGLRKEQTDRQFCQFVTMRYGIRALVITLRTYVIKYGLYHISEIICRFAPPNENETDKYIAFVAKAYRAEGYMEVPLIGELDFYDEGSTDLYILCKAICQIESGYLLSRTEFAEVLKMINQT